MAPGSNHFLVSPVCRSYLSKELAIVHFPVAPMLYAYLHNHGTTMACSAHSHYFTRLSIANSLLIAHICNPSTSPSAHYPPRDHYLAITLHIQSQPNQQGRTEKLHQSVLIPSQRCICLSNREPVHLSIQRLSGFRPLAVNLSVRLSIRLSVCGTCTVSPRKWGLSVCLSVRLSTCQSICPWHLYGFPT
jgi:hypothetical protein